MKAIHYFCFGTLLFWGLNATAQKTTLGYTKGQVFHFSRQDAPNMLTAYPDSWKVTKPKERKALEERFQTEVNQGLHKGKSFDFEMSVSNIFSGSDGTIYEFEFVSGEYRSYSYNSCINDTLYVTRSLTGYPMVSEGDTVGLFMPGLVRYPLTLKVGDVLPATTDMSFTFPKKMDLSYQRQVIDQVYAVNQSKSYQGYHDSQTNYYYTLKNVTKNLTYTLQFSAPTVTYRHVVGEQDVTVGGKTYKAYKIEVVQETRVKDIISNVDADVLLDKWALEFLNNYIVKKANSEDLKVTGYELFVPEIGAVAIVELFDSQGKTQYKVVLNSF